MSLFATMQQAADWSNRNQGVVSIFIFAATLLFGWVSGIFSALRRRPRFRIRTIEGPTFCSTFLTGAKHENFDIYRSAFAVYLHVSNVGSASGSIDAVHLGYHWQVRPFTLTWLRYGVGWFWLKNQTAVIHDFQANIGDNLKIYPFLFQKSVLSGTSSDTFLQTGQSTNGVIYFEKADSWDGCFPAVRHNRVKVRVKIIDAFGRSYARTIFIPSVTPDEARVYNPSFGSTFSHLRGELRETTPDDATLGATDVPDGFHGLSES